MTLRYRPPVGSKGSYLQCRREAAALYHALCDPATFAAYLNEGADATVGLCEPHEVEVGISVERIDGELTITAFERDPVRVRVDD